MKIAMVILYLYSFRGGLVAHDSFFTLEECVTAAEDVAKATRGTSLEAVCIPQMPLK